MHGPERPEREINNERQSRHYQLQEAAATSVTGYLRTCAQMSELKVTQNELQSGEDSLSTTAALEGGMCAEGN